MLLLRRLIISSSLGSQLPHFSPSFMATLKIVLVDMIRNRIDHLEKPWPEEIVRHADIVAEQKEAVGALDNLVRALAHPFVFGKYGMQGLSCAYCKATSALVLSGHAYHGQGGHIFAYYVQCAASPRCDLMITHLSRHHSKEISAMIFPEGVPGFKSRICIHCRRYEKDDERFQQCSKCKTIYYCGTACQKEHWPQHKAACSEFVK
jgi:hypothetical protein